jgi:hypothetical protein
LRGKRKGKIVSVRITSGIRTGKIEEGLLDQRRRVHSPKDRPPSNLPIVEYGYMS